MKEKKKEVKKSTEMIKEDGLLIQYQIEKVMARRRTGLSVEKHTHAHTAECKDTHQMEHRTQGADLLITLTQ